MSDDLQNMNATNCTDPNWVIKEGMVQLTDFIDYIGISTFEGEYIHLSWNDNLTKSLFKPVDFVYDPLSTEMYNPEIRSCYELILPEKLQRHGIQNIYIMVDLEGWDEANRRHSIMISPPGFFYQNSDVQRREFKLYEEESFDLVYQIDKFLKIGDEDCNPDPVYSRDECVIEELLTVKKYSFDNTSLGKRCIF